MVFTVHEASEVSGLGLRNLKNWIYAGIIQPAHPGTTGQGRGHRFSLAQVIGLAAAVRYKAEGAGFDRCVGVMKLIESLGIERLEHHLQKSPPESFPVPAMMIAGLVREMGGARVPAYWVQGMMIQPPTQLNPLARALIKRLDLGVIKEDVEQRIAELSRRPKRVHGRKRGGVSA